MLVLRHAAVRRRGGRPQPTFTQEDRALNPHTLCTPADVPKPQRRADADVRTLERLRSLQIRGLRPFTVKEPFVFYWSKQEPQSLILILLCFHDNAF